MRKYKLFDKEKILNRVKRLDEQEGFFQSKIKNINDEKEKISKKIQDNFQIFKIKDPCIQVQLREKLLKNDEIRTLIEKYHIPIDDIALIEDRCERLAYPPPWMKPWNIHQFEFALKSNYFEVIRHYLYGSPESNLKVSFRNCKNGRYVLVGYTFRFPEKKRDWKSVIQGKKKAA